MTWIDLIKSCFCQCIQDHEQRHILWLQSHMDEKEGKQTVIGIALKPYRFSQFSRPYCL